MKQRLKAFQAKTTEMNEYQLSILIHLLLLIVMSIAMTFKTLPGKQAKVVPVTLVAQIDKPKAGSVVPEVKETGSKKAESNNKITKPKDVAPVKAEKPKSSAKRVKKADPKPTQKAKTTKKAKNVSTKAKASDTSSKKNTPKEEAKASVVAVKPAPTNLPSVISTAIAANAPIRPTHQAPLFEEIGDITAGPSQNTPMLDPIGSSVMSVEDSMLMTESILDDSMMFAAPTDISPIQTGVNNGQNGNGVFEVGSIEAFGGNSENFVAPRIITKVQPTYPEWARKQGIHGSAVYRILILPSGTVGDVVTLSSTIDPKLAINGAQALRRWVFTPVLNNGVPQETWVKISVDYELN